MRVCKTSYLQNILRPSRLIAEQYSVIRAGHRIMFGARIPAARARQRLRKLPARLPCQGAGTARLCGCSATRLGGCGPIGLPFWWAIWILRYPYFQGAGASRIGGGTGAGRCGSIRVLFTNGVPTRPLPFATTRMARPPGSPSLY